METLNQNVETIEAKFRVIRDAPKKILEEAHNWRNIAQLKLDNFSKGGEDYIAYDMLEDKQNKDNDVIRTGERLVEELERQRDLPVP